MYRRRRLRAVRRVGFGVVCVLACVVGLYAGFRIMSGRDQAGVVSQTGVKQPVVAEAAEPGSRSNSGVKPGQSARPSPTPYYTAADTEVADYGPLALQDSDVSYSQRVADALREANAALDADGARGADGTVGADGMVGGSVVGGTVGDGISSADTVGANSAGTGVASVGSTGDASTTVSSASLATKILPDTKIIYEYYNNTGKLVKSTSETATDSLYGMTRDRLAETFSGWRITNFTPEIVVLRKTIETGTSNYIVGVQNGYVAIFYEQPFEESKLKEMTKTPITTLSLEEQKKLMEGIKVVGDETLAKVLQDYGS